MLQEPTDINEGRRDPAGISATGQEESVGQCRWLKCTFVPWCAKCTYVHLSGLLREGRWQMVAGPAPAVVVARVREMAGPRGVKSVARPAKPRLRDGVKL